MKIVPDYHDFEAGSLPGLAIFWRRTGWQMAFHADLHLWPGETYRQAAKRFHGLCQGAIIASIRDRTGRFVAFK